jgi:hypothetical protein
VIPRDQDGARDRQVEARAALAQRRGGEVHRHALEREREPRVQDRRADTLARLAHRPVGEADDGEVREAGADVDLDSDAARLEAVDRERGDAGEHARHARERPVTAKPRICNESAQSLRSRGVR